MGTAAAAGVSALCWRRGREKTRQLCSSVSVLRNMRIDSLTLLTFTVSVTQNRYTPTGRAFSGLIFREQRD